MENKETASALRDLAAQLKEAAEDMSIMQKTAAETVELDPEKVRDFLLFYGAKYNE